MAITSIESNSFSVINTLKNHPIKTGAALGILLGGGLGHVIYHNTDHVSFYLYTNGLNLLERGCYLSEPRLKDTTLKGIFNYLLSSHCVSMTIKRNYVALEYIGRIYLNCAYFGGAFGALSGHLYSKINNSELERSKVQS